MGKCTARQAEVLGDHGYDTTNLTFDEASALLTALKANNWVRPDGVASPSAKSPAPASRAPAPQRGATATQAPPRGRDANRQGGGKRNTPTDRQKEVLADFGYDATGWTFDDARATLDALAENGWQPLEDEAEVQGFSNPNDVPFSD